MRASLFAVYLQLAQRLIQLLGEAVLATGLDS